jgi:hypothetical protein
MQTKTSGPRDARLMRAQKLPLLLANSRVRLFVGLS